MGFADRENQEVGHELEADRVALLLAARCVPWLGRWLSGQLPLQLLARPGPLLLMCCSGCQRPPDPRHAALCSHGCSAGYDPRDSIAHRLGLGPAQLGLFWRRRLQASLEAALKVAAGPSITTITSSDSTNGGTGIWPNRAKQAQNFHDALPEAMRVYEEQRRRAATDGAVVLLLLLQHWWPRRTSC